MRGKKSRKRSIPTSVDLVTKKAKQLERLRACLPAIAQCEQLEKRLLFSVSGITLTGPIFTPGTSWTYQLTTAGGDTATYTRTVVGPTTFDGHAVTEVDTTIGKATGKEYVATDANGEIVEYGQDSTSTFGDDYDVYSPYSLVVPASMTAGVVYTSSDTDTDTSTGTDGVSNPSVNTSTDDDSVELISQTTQSITVPLGTYDTYQVHSIDNNTTTTTDDQGNETTQTVTTPADVWSADGIGEVKAEDDNGNVYALIAFTSNGEALSFTQQPTDTDKGDTIDPIKVQVNRATGGLDTDATGSITLKLNSVTGDGKLSGTVTEALVNGVATFSDLKVDGGGTYTFTATDDSTPPVTLATSNQFEIEESALTWTGKGDGVNWSDPKNWDGNVKPMNGDSLVFPGGSPLTSNNDLTGLSIASIDIQGSGYTLKGNAISLTGSLTSEAGNNTYNIDTKLVGSPTLTDTTGDLTIKSTLSGDGLTVGGGGKVTFDQANSYTGPTTLQAGVTIDDSVLNGAFGTNKVTIGAGAAGVEIDDTAESGAATIDNDITFQDGATLAADPQVILGGTITINGTDTLAPVAAGDEIDIEQGSLAGSGTIIIKGGGVVVIDDDLNAGINVVVASGQLDLSGNLGAANGTQQITVKGGLFEALKGMSGTGGIDVQNNGVMVTDEANAGGIAGYTGTITLETGGTIKVYDTVDDKGLGVGELDLKGGLLQNSAGSLASLSNAVKVESNITVSGGKGLVFSGENVTFSAAGLAVTGNVGFRNSVTLAGDSDVVTSAASDVIDFGGGFSGDGTSLSEDGLGSVGVEGEVGSGVSLIANGTYAGATGALVISGKLSASANQVTINTGGRVQLSGSGSTLGVASGSGGIDVKGGTLLTDAGGIAGYTGTITLEPGGTIKVYDTADGKGLGVGELDLKGGLLQNTSGGIATIHNNITFDGSVDVSSRGSRLKLAGNVSIAGNGSMNVFGSVALIGNVDGDGTIVLNGDEFAVAGSNPAYIGNIILNTGVIEVTNDNALGEGKLQVNAAGAENEEDYLKAVASIGDPILDNPLVVNSGTLVVTGEFSFPNGVTVAKGATLLIQGANTSVVVAGPLSGGGTVLLNGGTFSATGDQSGFTGSITQGTGKFIPTITVKDAGGIFTGSAYPATVTLTGDGTPPGATLDGVSPTLLYYTGSTATGTGTSTAPSAIGTYTVVASFAGSANYAAATSTPLTFAITAVAMSKTTPTLAVTDAGGVFTGSPFAATYTLTGSSGEPTTTLDGVAATLTYYVGTTATGTGTGTAPSSVGTYTVVASFAGSANYNPVVSVAITFVITPASVKSVPTLTVTDAGGVYTGSPFPAVASLIGTSGQPAATLDGVAPTLTYYIGAKVTGTGTYTPPTNVGTYTVVASFAGSANYSAAQSSAVTFVIAAAHTVLPTVTAPGVASVIENGSLTFSAVSSNAIGVADATANGKAEQLTISVTHGTIQLASLTGLKFISGANGSATITVQGTIATLNAALNGLKYAPTIGFTGSAALQVKITDLKTRLAASSSVAITVKPASTNTPKIVIKAFPHTAVRGQSIGIDLDSSSLKTLSKGKTVTYHVAFGDGTSATFVGSFKTFLRHVYQSVGNYSITVTATDQAGHTSAVATTSVKVVSAAVEVNPHNPKQSTLYVGGTTGNDTFGFQETSKHAIAVTVNHVPAGTFATSGHILIEGQGGTDVVKAAKQLRNRIHFA